MSSKRPSIDLLSLTSDTATPMAEAVQRTAHASDTPTTKDARLQGERVASANLEALAFKVPPSFRRRFRSRAAEADMKLNELLFAAFEAWEEKQGFKK